MGLLLVIALIFTTGNFVEVSATNKTICDVMPENTTCTQYSCDQPPCSLQCIQSYDSCLQNCNETTCNTVACSSSVTRCNQDCPNGHCKEYRCDAMRCFQTCTEGGNCTTMRCANSMSGSSCEQGDAKELFCDSEICQQDCSNCTMMCSSSVKTCTQVCSSGNCFYQCDAQNCQLTCPGGHCTKIKSSTTPTSATSSTSATSPTSATSKIPSLGICYHATISLVSGLLPVVLVFI